MKFFSCFQRYERIILLRTKWLPERLRLFTAIHNNRPIAYGGPHVKFRGGPHLPLPRHWLEWKSPVKVLHGRQLDACFHCLRWRKRKVISSWGRHRDILLTSIRWFMPGIVLLDRSGSLVTLFESWVAWPTTSELIEEFGTDIKTSYSRDWMMYQRNWRTVGFTELQSRSRWQDRQNAVQMWFWRNHNVFRKGDTLCESENDQSFFQA